MSVLSFRDYINKTNERKDPPPDMENMFDDPGPRTESPEAGEPAKKKFVGYGNPDQRIKATLQVKEGSVTIMFNMFANKAATPDEKLDWHDVAKNVQQYVRSNHAECLKWTSADVMKEMIRYYGNEFINTEDTKEIQYLREQISNFYSAAVALYKEFPEFVAVRDAEFTRMKNLGMRLSGADHPDNWSKMDIVLVRRKSGKFVPYITKALEKSLGVPRMTFGKDVHIDDVLVNNVAENSAALDVLNEVFMTDDPKDYETKDFVAVSLKMEEHYVGQLTGYINSFVNAVVGKNMNLPQAQSLKDAPPDEKLCKQQIKLFIDAIKFYGQGRVHIEEFEYDDTNLENLRINWLAFQRLLEIVRLLDPSIYKGAKKHNASVAARMDINDFFLGMVMWVAGHRYMPPYYLAVGTGKYFSKSKTEATISYKNPGSLVIKRTEGWNIRIKPSMKGKGVFVTFPFKYREGKMRRFQEGEGTFVIKTLSHNKTTAAKIQSWFVKMDMM
jgi:hypothetical protein